MSSKPVRSRPGLHVILFKIPRPEAGEMAKLCDSRGAWVQFLAPMKQLTTVQFQFQGVQYFL